ncbi:hypothetical protein ACLKA6_011193 [Drosophila palustris]
MEQRRGVRFIFEDGNMNVDGNVNVNKASSNPLTVSDCGAGGTFVPFSSVQFEPLTMQQGRRWILIRLLLHVVATLQLGYAVYYDYHYAKLPAMAVELRMEAPLGGKFKYLTFLNGLLQTGYHLLALSCDLWTLRGLHRLRDYLLASIVLPLGLTVSITFWALCGLYRESVYPDFLVRIYPVWLNQTMHTHVVVYALLDLCVAPHRYPQRKQGLAGLGIAMGCYLVWLHLVHYSTGIWVYPFLSALFAPLRWCFFALIVGLSFGCYLLGERLNYALWAQ